MWSLYINNATVAGNKKIQKLKLGYEKSFARTKWSIIGHIVECFHLKVTTQSREHGESQLREFFFSKVLIYNIEASQSKVSNQKGIVPIIALYIGVSVLPPASALSVELGVTLGKLIWGKSRWFHYLPSLKWSNIH